MLAPLRFLVGSVAGEVAGRCKLAELVTHHFLVHEDRDELLAVVDVEGQADEIRQDRRTARPGLDRRAGSTSAVRGFRLSNQQTFLRNTSF